MGGDELCSVGLLGTVTRVLNGWLYPKNVVVRFGLEDVKEVVEGGRMATTTPSSFEAHFFPGQLRRE